MSLKLLAVSSDPLVIRQVQMAFEPLGCEVGMCANSGEGDARVEQEKVHGVFVNVQNELSDLAFVRHIRRSRLNATTPVVLAAEREDAATLRTGFSAGANFIVGTPLNGDRLRSLFVVLRVLMVRAKIWHVRLPYQALVRCSQGNQAFESSCYNLSERGMLLDGANRLGVGDRVQLEFPLPRYTRHIQARARVVRRDAAERLGLHFVEIAPEQHQALQHFLSEQLQG